METTITTIDRSQTTDIRVRLCEWHGKTFVDVRQFVVADATERVPTRKGIAIPPSLLPDVISALQEAAARLEDEAEAA